MAELITGP